MSHAAASPQFEDNGAGRCVHCGRTATEHPSQPLRAYVSIRGSRSPRRVDRDASPIPYGGSGLPDPYAALCFPLSGGATRFELSYVMRRALVDNGVYEEVPVVQLTLTRPGKEPLVLWSGEVFA